MWIWVSLLTIPVLGTLVEVLQVILKRSVAAIRRVGFADWLGEL